MTEAMGKLEIKEVVLGGDLTQSNPHFSGYLECFQLYDTKLLPSTIKGLRFCPNRHSK